MRFSYSIFAIIYMFSLSACTPTKHEQALTHYQKAIKEKNLNQLFVALTTLVQHAPEKYQTELDQIKKVDRKLQKAKSHLKNANYYLAYLNSHDSYHNFPNLLSKQVLVQSGKVMLAILRIESALNQSMNTIPTNLQEAVLSYKRNKVTEWNLIEVNKLLENIHASLHQLTNALTIAQKNNISDYSLELSFWTESIDKQKQYITLLKGILIHSALYQSTLQLQQHNQVLTENAEDLLSLVRESTATDGLQPIFFKAQQAYQPYLVVNENLSLADVTQNRNQHSIWYNDWRQLENATLTMPKPVASYLLKAKQRTKEFNNYLKKEQELLTILTQHSQNIDDDILIPSEVKNLIEKLKKDKTLLLYGLARSSKNKEYNEN